MLNQVLRTSRRRRSFCPIAASISMSRAAARGISKAGEPSRPTFSRTGPSIGAITLVANMHVVAGARAGRHVDIGAEEVVLADAALARAGRRGSTSSTLPSHRPSEATVPAPIEHRNGLSWPCSLPKFEPVVFAEAELPADPAQVGLDEHRVAEHQVEEAASC